MSVSIVARSINTLLKTTILPVLVFVAMAGAHVATQNVGLSLIASAEAADQKTRRLPGISEKIMKRLAVITELTNPDTEKNANAQPNFPEALKELRSLEKTCERSCNEYEKAQVYRFYAFAYYSMDNYPKAIEAYKQVYSKSPNIPIAVELDALNALSQLSYSQEDYDSALKYLNLWMDLSTIVGADKIFLRGTIYYAKDDKLKAIRDVNKAISMLEAKGKIAKEQWYNLQVALYLEKEDFKSALPILEKLVSNYPKVKWWTQLGNIYGMLGREKDQLGSLDAVHVMGGLDKGRDIINTAYLYLGENAPYKAAKILQDGIEQKKVERNSKYLKILANAWRAAKETDKAITATQQAAKVAAQEDKANKGKKKYQPEQGNIYAELVALYLDKDDSEAAVKAGKSALKVGNLKKPCEVHTNMGIAYVDMRKYKSAIGSFKEARKDKQCRAFVNSWLRYAENEQKQQEALSDS